MDVKHNGEDVKHADEEDVKHADEEEDMKDVMGLDDFDPEEVLTLISQEGAEFHLPKKIAFQSELVKTMATEGEDQIPLPSVNCRVLQKVIEFMTHQLEEPLAEIKKPIKSADMTEVVPSWEAKFVDVDKDVLFEVITAANYMDIPSLMELSCAAVAALIKGKEVEEMREIFGIENDFTPEEEALIIAENKWAEDSH